MNKSELIEALRCYPDDALILVDGGETGYENVRSVAQKQVFRIQDKSSYWNGSYKESSSFLWEDEASLSATINAVVVGR